MNSKTEEALGILQEECAEVIQEVSKCRRFGLYSTHHKTGMTHNQMLEMEIGDVMAMVDILVDQGIIDREALAVCAQNKKDKLRKWSKIYE